MSAGDLTAFLMYSLYTGFNISGISGVYSELKRAAGAAGRIFEVTDRAPAMPLAGDPTAFWRETEAEKAGIAGSGFTRRLEVKVKPTSTNQPQPSAAALAAAVPQQSGGASQFTTNVSTVLNAPLRRLEKLEGTVTFDNVSFSYPSRSDVPVLKGFSLTVPAGATLALVRLPLKFNTYDDLVSVLQVGGSGSGKSTVGSLLTRLYDPTQGGGAVRLDGVDIRELDPAWLRSVIGVVSQEPALFATSIAE
jgi:ABC-type multidrug transport system fused ATPase/permease subunit